MKIRSVFRSATEKTARLRNTVAHISYTKAISTLPDDFANLLSLYDTANIDVRYRNDIHHILNGAVTVATVLVDETFDADRATNAIATQIAALSRLQSYIASRPYKVGYSILFTTTGMLLGQFTTEQEARQHLQSLANLGHVKNAVVVPVKITSQFCLRPEPPEPLSGALPPGIVPEAASETADPVPMLDLPSSVKIEKLE